jgi:siderophore synthetase component
MRTVAVLADPTTHLKLPLPTSTLGLRNRRTIKPGTLSDGAIVGRLLAEVIAAERFDRILLADEQTYGHAGDETLAFLVRRYPVLAADVVPLAALGARTEHGPTVLDELAWRHFGGDRTALLTGYLTLLLDFHVTLLLCHGIALEAHQQNVSLVLNGDGIRLLYKDNDGPRVCADRLRPATLADRRILVDGVEPLVDVFTTITLHLCAAAIVFAANGMSSGRRMIADLLTAAIERHPDSPARRTLLARTLHADRLPIKAMVTAGTLQSKQRSGAADINKCYRRTGPNYLATERS